MYVEYMKRGTQRHSANKEIEKMAQLTLNKIAIAQFAGATKARARVANGTLQIRPTDRVSGKRLPAGEILVDVKRMGIFNKLDLSALNGQELGVTVADGAALELVAAKHGWLSLAATDGKGTVKAA